MSDTKYNLSDKIKKLRMLTGLTQYDFAKYFKISRSTLGALEDGRALPNLHFYKQLKKKGISIHEFVFGRKFKK